MRTLSTPVCPSPVRRLPLATFALVLALVAGATASTAPVAAQRPVVEEQVALDSAGTLLRMGGELARQLGLFADVEGLQEVLLFRGTEGFTLELTTRRDGRLGRERRPLTDAEATALRAQVARLLALRAPATLVDRTGRSLLLATSTAAGLGFYGWAVPSLLDIDSTRGQIALYMLVSSASFVGPWLWSGDRQVTQGMANAAFWGASRGAAHGIALHRLVEGREPSVASCPDQDPQCFETAADERDAWRRRLAAAVAASLGEGIGAMAWARSTDASPGDAHLVGLLSDFGAGWGAGLAMTLGADHTSTALWGAGLAGAAGGFAGGLVFAGRRDYSWDDAEVFRTAGLVGGYGGAVLADISGSNDEEVFAALAVAGSVAGLALGDRLVRDRRLTAGQGVLVDLGTVAGGLLGLGIAFLATDSDSPTPHLVLSALGAGAGFGLTYASLAGPNGSR